MGPRSRLPPHEQAKGAVLAHIQAAFSIPNTTSNTSKMAFSMIYTAAVTFPFVVTVTSWLYLLPIDDAVPALAVPPQVLRCFSIATSSVINSVIAFIEIVVLSSVRKQKVDLYLDCSSILLLIYIATSNPHLGSRCRLHCVLLVGLHWSLLHPPSRIPSLLRPRTSWLESVIRDIY